MAWKEIVGARFSPAEFEDYVRQLVFTTWRPQFVVVHNTGIPSLADRPMGFTSTHIHQNLVHYYRDTQGWSAGPHCFVDQNGIWVFTPLTTSGVHSPSWNSISWGVETLGDYSTEAFTDPIHEHLVACLATLHAVIPLDVSKLRFHKEDPLTTHACPGVNMNKLALIHDVKTLISSRQTLADPARGRYTGDSPADVAPQSHFFTDHGAVTQTDAIAYGPVISTVPADKENKFRVTGLFKAAADVEAYAIVTGIVMLQRVADPANPGSYLPNVVNLVLKPYEQAMRGFTPVKYFVYRNLRLDDFLQGSSAADETLVRDQTGASPFIQNLWAVYTAQNGAVPFASRVLGYDPAAQPGTAGIAGLFHRQNSNEQLPFATRGDRLGNFYTNAGADAFGIEIILEGDFEPNYDYVRKSTEVIIDVSGKPTGQDQEKLTVLLERSGILNYIDPAAFFSLHMAAGGWLQVKDGAGKRKLTDLAVHDQVIEKFSTANTLYVDIRNENGLPLDFYGAYDDGTGNALEVGTTSSSLAAQAYATDKWPLLIRKSAAEANTNAYNLLFLRLRRTYNKKPILYIEHGQPDAPTTNGRFIADTDLISAAATTTNVIGFRYPNKDRGTGNRIGVAWLLKLHYATRQDATSSPFPPKVVPTATYLDNLFGPVDFNPPWAVSNPAIAWATLQDKKYVDGDGIAALGFEHTADRGVAFSEWTGAASTAGNVLLFAAAKDSLANGTHAFVPQNGLVSGVSNRGSFFDEAMLFDGYSVERNVIVDGAHDVQTMALKETQPYSRPPEAMLLLGLTRTELEGLKPLAGLDGRYPRNLLLEEATGSPFTDVKGRSYYKYKVGLSGMKPDGNAHRVFPAADLFVYSSDRKFFFSRTFTQAQPPPKVQKLNAEEKRGEEIRFGVAYAIVAAAGVVVTVSPPVNDPPIDFTREVVPGDTVTIRNAGYAVLSVTAVAGNAAITLDQAPGALTPGTDTLRSPNKPLQDYYIAKDRLGLLSGIARMEALVEQFATSLSAVPDDATAPTAIELLVNDYGPKILQRARLICNHAGFSYADDRILYWARIKMMVCLKNHPYLMRVEVTTERDRLAKIFDTKSRGYDAVSFSAAGGCKKVLIAGFDPFQIPENKARSNPSGAAALALHGQSFPTGAPTIHVQSAIFPVRYADFSNNPAPNEGTGVVENFFERFINVHHKDYVGTDKPDIIVTLSQSAGFNFELDRYACRTRSDFGDNLDLTHSPFPDTVDGDQFYETTLAETKIVPTNNIAGVFKIFYNNFFWYQWDSANAYYPPSIMFPNYRPIQPDSGTKKIEADDHPEHGLLFGMVPSDVTDSTTPNKTQIKAKTGSGSNYLSNEIFYRVARLRFKHNPPMLTGHLHLPMIQHHENGTGVTYSGVDPSIRSTKDLHPGRLKQLIQEIINSLVRACS